MAVTDFKPLPLTAVEQIWLLRKLKSVKESLSNDLLLLQERVTAGVFEAPEQYRQMDSEHAICDGIVRKLWQLT